AVLVWIEGGVGGGGLGCSLAAALNTTFAAAAAVLNRPGERCSRSDRLFGIAVFESPEPLSRSATAASDFSDDRSSARRSRRRMASLRLAIFGCELSPCFTTAKI